MIRALIMLALVAALASSAQAFLSEGAGSSGAAVLAFGFVLVAAVQSGHVFYALRMPHLTGYLLCGLVFGPDVLGLLTPAMVEDLALVKRVAIGLIALTAGCELSLRALRPHLRVVGATLGGALGLGVVSLWALLYFAVVPALPFPVALEPVQRAVVALVGANVLVALSPAVVMGIVAETRSAGPTTERAIAAVVVADLIIVVTFALTESAVVAVFPGVAGATDAVSLAGHVLGSLAVGAALGLVLALFVGRVQRKVGLFVFGVLFVVAEAGGAFHLDPLLVGLAAGLFLENVSHVSGHAVVHETESATLPVYAIFFATIGAEIDLGRFADVAGWAALCAVVRAVAFIIGVRAAAAGLRAPRETWFPLYMAFLPQAGVALALAALLESKFVPWGQTLALLVVGTVVITQITGPILWRWALMRTGEAGRRDAPEPAPFARRASTEAPTMRTPPPDVV